MKAGEVANGKKFDAGLKEVQKAYGKSGHIQAHMEPTPQFDEAATNVTFKIAVSEGPQFRMGTVDFKGFSPEDASTLTKLWELKSGAVYDQTYAGRFLHSDAGEMMYRIARERQTKGKPTLNLDTREILNRESLIVNLVIELKD
jgi:outer membrane protein assembly factor BamA